MVLNEFEKGGEKNWFWLQIISWACTIEHFYCKCGTWSVPSVTWVAFRCDIFLWLFVIFTVVAFKHLLPSIDTILDIRFRQFLFTMCVCVCLYVTLYGIYIMNGIFRGFVDRFAQFRSHSNTFTFLYDRDR